MGHHESEYSNCSSYPPWPAIIFGVILIIVLLAVLFYDAPSSAKGATFLSVLLFGLIWLAILWWLAIAGWHAASWFFLILPIAIAITYAIAYWISSATAPDNCVTGGINFSLLGNSALKSLPEMS